MADSHPPQPTNGPAAKTRNPVERLIVWGLIGVLLVAVAIEFQSRMSYQKAMTTLQDGVERVDKDAKQPEVTEADVKAAVGSKTPIKTEDFKNGKISPNGASRLEVYSWFTLNPSSKREMWVYYGAKGKKAGELATVLEIQSSDTIAAPPQMAEAANPGQEGAPAMSGPPEGMTRNMGGPPGMRGPGGGARGRPGSGNAEGAAADKPDTEKADTQTTADEKPGTENLPEEKPAEDKTDKADTNNE
jgi:hypothetical protein